MDSTTSISRRRSFETNIPGLPKTFVETVRAGEQSGSLEETLDVIGEYFDNEVEVTTARLLSVLEPIITIALAVIVVVLLLAVYLPLFTLYGGM